MKTKSKPFKNLKNFMGAWAKKLLKKISYNEPMIKEVLKAIAEMFKLPTMFVAFKIYFNHLLSVWFGLIFCAEGLEFHH